MPTEIEVELSEAANALRRLLEAVERGELTAPGPMIAHLQGALATVEALGGIGESVGEPR